MPALSTSTITASDSASKAAVRSGTRGADKSSDGSPFAALLTATSRQTTPAKPKSDTTQAANNNDASTAQNTDPQTSAAQAQSPPRSHNDGAVSKDNGKRDKKADSGKGASDDVAAAVQQPQQTQQAPPSVPIVAAAITPVIPANTQAASPTEDDSGPDAIEPAVSAAANSGPVTQPAGGINQTMTSKPVAANQPQPASQPAPTNDPAGPVVQTPTLVAAAANTDNAPTDSPVSVSTLAQKAVSTIIQNTGPAPQPKASDGKPAIDKTASTNPAAKPQVDPQTLSQPAPAMDDDAEPVPQTVAATPPAANAPNPAASRDSATIAAIALAANAAPPSAPKSDTKNAPPANNPAQVAAGASSPPPAIQAAATTPSLATPPGKDNVSGTGSVPAAPSSDSKPVHVAAADAATPQPDTPALQAAPVPQPAPPPALPQGMVTDNIVAAPLGANTGGAAISTTLHIAAASDADPTPTLSALAVSVAARSLSGAKQFEIRLDPPELGRVDVRLSIDASGKTQAHMTADQPQTLDLLQKDAPTLTQALRDAGLDVSQSGLNFSLRGQDRQGDDAGAGQGRRTNLTATRTIQAAQTPTALSVNGAAADARVDIHV